MEEIKTYFLAFLLFRFCFSNLHSEIALCTTLPGCFNFWPISVGTATFVECDDERVSRCKGVCFCGEICERKREREKKGLVKKTASTTTTTTSTINFFGWTGNPYPLLLNKNSFLYLYNIARSLL